MMIIGYDNTTNIFGFYAKPSSFIEVMMIIYSDFLTIFFSPLRMKIEENKNVEFFKIRPPGSWK
jgi:hypothetical protein